MDDNSRLGILECSTTNNSKQKLLTSSVDEGTHEISDMSIFHYLIKNNSNPFIGKKLDVPRWLQIIDDKSKIIEVETHRQRPSNSGSNGLTDIFIVFQTKSEIDGDFWWSLDKQANQITMQRSHDKDAVKNNFKGKSREGIELIAEKLEEKGSIKEFFTLLWIHMIINIEHQRDLSRCESIIPLIMKKITKTRYEYDKSDFKYSALSAEEKNPDLRDIIDYLSNVSNWHPLVIAIYLGDVELLDQVEQDGKYNVNGIYNKFTLLNLAILFYSKIEMIQHLLEKMRVNPLKQDKMGRNALHMAAKFNRETEIINLLLFNRKIEIDQCCTNGTTALNYAIMASNTNIVQCLLDNGADPKRFDQNDRSPLHVAAFYTGDTTIIDLLQNQGKVDINECNKFGLTALHYAVKPSNHTTACHLMKRGADVNCRDKRGLTPLHLAAFFAKEMDMINLFLNNRKVDLHCCDELGQNVVAYAKKNIYGLRQKIIDRLNEKDGEVIKEYNLLKLAKSDMPNISIWKRLFWNPENKPKFFFILFADLKPGKGWNISQSALIRYIANKESIEQLCSAQSEVFESPNDLRYIDPYSEIEQVEIYQSNVIMMLDGTIVYHHFMVFKTNSKEDGDYWWSLEKNVDCIVLQRSRDKETVKNKLNGKERRKVIPTHNNLVGMRGTIRNLFAVLWAYQIIQEKYPKKLADCQSFVNFVSKRIAEIGHESHISKESDDKIDFINTLLSSIPKWHPLFLAICLGNTKLFDEIEEMTKFDSNSNNNEPTPLNLAIALPNQTEMVRHLLEKQNADPTLRDGFGRNALDMAAICADSIEIIDLILGQNEKVNIDGCDESGRSALHFAAASSNVVATRRLMEKGAKPNVFDSHGFSPLHLAAYYSDNTDMMELILKALKEKGVNEAIDIVDDRTSDGITALYTAVIASNELTIKYLIKKGANPNIKDKFGCTPLHMAAFFAKDMKIINVLLSDKKLDVNSLDNDGQNALYYAESNKNGLSKEIVNRLKEIIVNKNIDDYSTVLIARFLNFKIGIVWGSFTLLCIFILVLFLAMENNKTEMYGWVMLLTIFMVLFIHFVCAFAYKIPRLSLIECISKLRNLKIKLPIFIVRAIHFLIGPSITFPLFEIKNLLYIRNPDQQFIDEHRWISMVDFFNASNQAGFHEISQDALFRNLLNKDTADFIDKLNCDRWSKTFVSKMCQMLNYLRDFKKEYHITNLEVYQSNINWLCNLLRFHYTFIVFKTTSGTDGCYWWSLDQNPENIVIQRSRKKIAVVNRLKGKDRQNVQIVQRKDDEGKETMLDLLTTLWVHNILPEKYHVVVNPNRQTFLQFIEKQSNNQSVAKLIKRQNKQQATSKQKKKIFKPKFSYCSYLLNKNKLDLLSDLIFKFPEWKPICGIIYLGEDVMFENLLGNNGNIPQDTNANLVYDCTTLLRLAILFSRTKMVEILLRKENLNFTFENEDRKSDMPWKDMSVFHMAAAFANDPKMIDLLLKQNKIKTDPDAKGRNALHFAAMKSNEIIVSHLLKIKWIDPNARDKSGISPLHLAAEHTDNTKIIDLILEAKNASRDRSRIDDCDSIQGRTALHHAVIGSNVTIAQHLMEKGANPNKRDKDGYTPLALAAKLAKVMKIIDLFLNNKIVCKELEEKGRDPIYNCAILNKTAAMCKEIERRLTGYFDFAIAKSKYYDSKRKSLDKNHRKHFSRNQQTAVRKYNVRKPLLIRMVS